MKKKDRNADNAKTIKIGLAPFIGAGPFLMLIFVTKPLDIQ